ncbi:MAG TPA: PilZ domain-containing protein [Thermoanaerobaculia bacterium]|jgi:hypothetical protein|nr:PilZ domain-containing protein [Thermoanaerobaculia bacterium]
MSALEHDYSDRRAAPRVRIDGSISALIGRGDGELIDLSRRGAKIRHTSLVRRGSAVRISFQCAEGRFSANAEVLASRVVAIGESGTTYESRLRFANVDAESQQTLDRSLDAISVRDMRKWVANLRGWSDESSAPQAPVIAGAFLRCRLVGIRWEVKCTSSTEQPPDGFVVPAHTPDAEIVTLCDTYYRADEDGRHTIRMMAAAAVE